MLIKVVGFLLLSICIYSIFLVIKKKNVKYRKTRSILMISLSIFAIFLYFNRGVSSERIVNYKDLDLYDYSGRYSFYDLDKKKGIVTKLESSDNLKKEKSEIVEFKTTYKLFGEKVKYKVLVNEDQF